MGSCRLFGCFLLLVVGMGSVQPNAHAYWPGPVDSEVVAEGRSCKITAPTFLLAQSAKELDEICDMAGIPRIRASRISWDTKRRVVCLFSGRAAKPDAYMTAKFHQHSSNPDEMRVYYTAPGSAASSQGGPFTPYRLYVVSLAALGGFYVEQETCLFLKTGEKWSELAPRISAIEKAKYVRFHNVREGYDPAAVKAWNVPDEMVKGIRRDKDEGSKGGLARLFALEAAGKPQIYWVRLTNPEPVESIVVQAAAGQPIPLDKTQTRRLMKVTMQRYSGLHFLSIPTARGDELFTITVKSRDKSVDFAVRQEFFRYRDIRLPVTVIYGPPRRWGQNVWILRRHPKRIKKDPLVDLLRSVAASANATGKKEQER